MSRHIKDESGNEVEVFEKDEVEALQSKIQELERGTKPDWREVRQKMDKMQEENEALEKKARELEAKSKNPGLDQDEVRKIAKEQAEQDYFNRYKERVMGQFGEKKESVSKYFDKLANGEKLTEEVIDRLADDAARAVGANRPGSTHRTNFGSPHSAPQFAADPADQGFGTTEGGKATAAAMGLQIEPPKQA